MDNYWKDLKRGKFALDRNGTKIKKGDKVKTREGEIETVLRINFNGNIETVENQYSWSPETLEKLMDSTKTDEQVLKNYKGINCVLRMLSKEGICEKQLVLTTLRTLTRFVDTLTLNKLRKTSKNRNLSETDVQRIANNLLLTLYFI